MKFGRSLINFFAAVAAGRLLSIAANIRVGIKIPLQWISTRIVLAVSELRGEVCFKLGTAGSLKEIWDQTRSVQFFHSSFFTEQGKQDMRVPDWHFA